MGRIRTLKPEFPQSESLGSVSRDARLLFLSLMTIADDEGRARGASRMLASLLFPYDDDAPALIEGWLQELERIDCIARYRAAGSTYLKVTNWLKHQKIDKPSASKLPPFDPSSRIISNPREEATTDLGPRTLDQEVSVASQPHPAGAGRKQRSSRDLEGFAAWYELYPRHKGRGAAEKAWPKAVRLAVGTGALLDALRRQLPGLLAKERDLRPHPASWLNGKRWLDEVAEPVLALVSPAAAVPPPTVHDRLAALPGAIVPDAARLARYPTDVGHILLGGWHADVIWASLADAAGFDLWAWPGDLAPFGTWLAALTLHQDANEVIVGTIRRVASRPGYVPPRTLAYFDAAVREATAGAPRASRACA